MSTPVSTPRAPSGSRGAVADWVGGEARVRRRLPEIRHDVHGERARLAAGFVDLDEVQPWKAAIPGLLGRPEGEISTQARTIIERVRRLALATGLRGVEQTPETSFVLAAALAAYPAATAVHVVRDGRDVATSLLERGWLTADRRAPMMLGSRSGRTLASGSSQGREAEFMAASDATRCAWAWRRYVTAAPGRPTERHDAIRGSRR